MECAALSRDAKTSRPSEREAFAAAEETACWINILVHLFIYYKYKIMKDNRDRLSQEMELARSAGETGQPDRCVYATILERVRVIQISCWFEMIPLRRLRSDQQRRVPRVHAIGACDHNNNDRMWIFSGIVRKPMRIMVEVERLSFLEENVSFKYHDCLRGYCVGAWGQINSDG